MKILMIALLLVCVGCAAADVTVKSMLGEMVDLGRLATAPDPFYIEAGSSSYDRASKTPGNPEWFANGDNTQYIRVEDHDGRKECVLMDAEGPGAIVRLWSANADNGGTIRVYLDGNEKPAIEVNCQDWMEGKLAAFPPPLAMRLAFGWNVYFPIPYAKHCKVTATARPAFYYQINYRTYAPGAKVETFTMDAARAAASEVKRVAAVMMERANPDVSKARKNPIDAKVEPGKTYKSPAIAGAAAIQLMELHVESPNVYNAVRQCVLRIYFDKEATPCVETPLGDFFGTGPGLNPYNSLPMGVGRDGTLTSRWVMPFQRTAHIELVNYGSVPITVTGTVWTTPYKWTKRSMYFHAGWRIEENIPTEPERDWNFLTATGKGRYVGNMLMINNKSTVWWGEGDEKVYVDGETFPSTFGTGTEDYYGYAYGSGELFQHAYHDQTIHDSPDCFGRDSLNRWHIFDDIPFGKDFRFDLEIWCWDRKATIDYAATAYWYAMPGAASAFKPLTADLVPITVRPTIMSVPGAIEAEDMEATETGGESGGDVAGVEFSGQHATFWRGMKEGDAKTFKVPVAKAGRYRIVGVFDCDPGHGIQYYQPAFGVYDVAVNGAAGPQRLDLSGKGLAHPKEVNLGTYDLKAGTNDLVFTCRSKSERNRGVLLTVDCFRLVAAP